MMSGAPLSLFSKCQAGVDIAHQTGKNLKLRFNSNEDLVQQLKKEDPVKLLQAAMSARNSVSSISLHLMLQDSSSSLSFSSSMVMLSTALVGDFPRFGKPSFLDLHSRMLLVQRKPTIISCFGNMTGRASFQ